MTSATGMPSQPRRMPLRAVVPRVRLIGAGSAMATASTSLMLACTESSMSAMSSVVRSSSLSARWS